MRARIAEALDNLERVKAIEAATLERLCGGLKDLPAEVPALRGSAGREARGP